MFKVLVLQKFHGLSDDATEEQIIDRTSYRNFLCLRIGDDNRDAKTLWDFKQCMVLKDAKTSRKHHSKARQSEPCSPAQAEKSGPKR